MAEIRDASVGDAAAIASIWNPLIRDTVITFTNAQKNETEIATMIAGREAFLVLDRGGVIGFASYAQFRGGPGYRWAQEHTIMLAPEARGQGGGRALLERLEVRARISGHRALIGAVSGSNPAGIAFHAALGYVQVGRVPEVGWKSGRFHDLVLMHKIL